MDTPITPVRLHNVKIGKNVNVMPGCLIMVAGVITIEDGAMIAANVQLISNNHYLYTNVISSPASRFISAKTHGAYSTIFNAERT